MFPDNVSSGFRPDLVTPEDCGVALVTDVIRFQDTFSDHLLHKRICGLRLLRKGPVNSWRIVDRHPVDLRGRQLAVMRYIVKRSDMNHALFINIRIDSR